jgi:predicted XRE-type DNA-binding protein
MKSRNESVEGDFVVGSGNVFADLGLPDADVELAKAELAYAIRTHIDDRKLTQTEAAVLLETDQARVSAIMRGKVSGYTYDRLVRWLNKLKCDVALVVCPSRSATTGKIRVELS